MEITVDNAKILIKLYKKRIIDGTCWRHKGTHDKNGYGRIQLDGKLWEIHRLSAHIFLGLDLSSRLMSLHKIECKYKDCWNPDHLYIGNFSDNMRDAVKTKTHKESRKTHCSKDHEYNKENTYITPQGHRHCRICNRNNKRK